MTSNALRLLAFLIEEKDEDAYSEIEKLHRYNIHQVGKLGQSPDNTYFDNISRLIYVLLEGQKIEEAHNLCISIMEYVESALGKGHFWYYEYQERLGCIFLNRGMISESIKLFHSIFLEADDYKLRVRACHNLGHALENCGNFREAIVMYKKCLLIEVQEEQWGDLANSKITCDGLGYCYEKLSQFQDALFLYENLLEKVKNVTEPEHPFIKEVESWISGVQELMEESSVSDEYDGREDTRSSHEVRMGEVDDSLGYGQFSENLADEVSLKEIFEIEDRGLGEKIADIGKQISSIKLS
ncbi:hypothetical protein EAE96_007293 [Botrytis aclada]|nr:hypothetical protein EAE96_007293 [Botrytis aclada]